MDFQSVAFDFMANNCGTGKGGFQPGNDCGNENGTKKLDLIEEGFAEFVTPQSFIEIRNSSTLKGFLSSRSPGDIKNHQLIVGIDGKIGTAVSHEGDIQNVFNNGGGRKGGAADVMIEAMRRGGNTLDCFAGFLPGYY